MRNPIRVCINPKCRCHLDGRYQPLYDAQRYCCIECERNQYRDETGRNYPRINERLFKEWCAQKQAERLELR